MVFAAREPHAYGEKHLGERFSNSLPYTCQARPEMSYLNNHPNPDIEEDLCGILQVSKAADHTGLRPMKLWPHRTICMGVLPLLLGDIKKTRVGSVEQGDAQGEPNAHEKVLDIVRKDYGQRQADWIHNLGQHPVGV
jgi:hypothetical protein